MDNTINFCSLLRLSSDIILFLDVEKKLYELNPKAEKFFHCRRQDILGTSFDDFCSKKGFQPSIPWHDTDFLRGQPVFGEELSIAAENGQQNSGIFTYLCILDDNKNPTSYLIVARDLTNTKLQLNQLEQDKQVAQLANISKHHFLAILSQEMRGHLSSILGMAQVLKQREDLDTEMQENITMIYESSYEMLPLLDHCLYYLEQEEAGSQANHEPFDLRNLLEGLVTKQYREAIKKNCELILYYPEKLPALVLGDEEKLRNVFAFILSHSVQTSTNGTIAITVSSQGLRSDRAIFTISVQDSSVGMSQQKVQALLASLNQMSIDSEHIDGCLKLSLSKYLLDRIGGEFDLASENGKGTKVTITIEMDLQENANMEQAYLWSFCQNSLRALVIDNGNPYTNLVYDFMGSDKNSKSTVDTCANDFNYAKKNADPFHMIVLDETVVEKHSDMLSELLMGISEKIEVLFLVLASQKNTKNIEILSSQSHVTLLEKPLLPSSIAHRLSTAWLEFKNAHMPSPAMKAGCAGPKILLIEDNPNNARVAEMMLHSLGCDVSIAISGEQAIEWIEDDRATYDMVLLDIGLPGRSGFEMAQLLREKLAYGKKLPILAMTAHVADVDQERCFKSGMNAIITKPVIIEELHKTFQKYLPDFYPE